MVISNINNQPTLPAQNRARVQEQDQTKRGEKQANGVNIGKGVVKIGEGLVGSERSQQMVVERVLNRVEQNTQFTQPSLAAQELFSGSGKTEFETRIAESQQDASPQATADRITDGITSYIFKAFQKSNPDMSAEDLSRFEEQVMAGFETGLNDAKGILSSLSALNGEVEENINKTETIVRDQLKSFFEEQVQRLQDQGATPTAEGDNSPEKAIEV